jgi:hypothetical protein
MCVDFKKLYPIPRIDEIFTRLSKSKFYTKFDFRQPYYQIKMHDDSIEKTAFATSSGLYEFNRLPFGLTNAQFFMTSKQLLNTSLMMQPHIQ